jgi:hypothetical protein
LPLSHRGHTLYDDSRLGGADPLSDDDSGSFLLSGQPFLACGPSTPEGRPSRLPRVVRMDRTAPAVILCHRLGVFCDLRRFFLAIRLARVIVFPDHFPTSTRSIRTGVRGNRPGVRPPKPSNQRSNEPFPSYGPASSERSLSYWYRPLAARSCTSWMRDKVGADVCLPLSRLSVVRPVGRTEPSSPAEARVSSRFAWLVRRHRPSPGRDGPPGCHPVSPQGGLLPADVYSPRRTHRHSVACWHHDVVFIPFSFVIHLVLPKEWASVAATLRFSVENPP